MKNSQKGDQRPQFAEIELLRLYEISKYNYLTGEIQKVNEFPGHYDRKLFRYELRDLEFSGIFCGEIWNVDEFVKLYNSIQIPDKEQYDRIELAESKYPGYFCLVGRRLETQDEITKRIEKQQQSIIEKQRQEKAQKLRIIEEKKESVKRLEKEIAEFNENIKKSINVVLDSPEWKTGEEQRAAWKAGKGKSK